MFRVCQGVNEVIILEILLTTLEAIFIFEAAGVVAKIGLSLKPNQHNQVKLVQIPDAKVMLCSKWILTTQV